jgi:hypothetical protein
LGGQFGPALAGAASNVPWQTPKAIFSYMTQQMPARNAGGLAQRDYILIEAFILQSNRRRASANPAHFIRDQTDPAHIGGSR